MHEGKERANYKETWCIKDSYWSLVDCPSPTPLVLLSICLTCYIYIYEMEFVFVKFPALSEFMSLISSTKHTYSSL